MAAGSITGPDPRPAVVVAGGHTTVTGVRCEVCRYPSAAPLRRCPECTGAMTEASFGPGGEVFASTVLRISIPPRTAPFGLAYVVLDDGPRVLAHCAADAAPPVGTRVRLQPPPPDGDPGDLYVEEETP